VKWKLKLPLEKSNGLKTNESPLLGTEEKMLYRKTSNTYHRAYHPSLVRFASIAERSCIKRSAFVLFVARLGKATI